VISGAALGTKSAEYIAWLWSRYGYRVNLSRFFQVTAVFLLVFVVQLFIYGFHELAEAHVLPNSDALHWATEPYGPDGVYGHYLTYMLVALPLGWLIVSAFFSRGRNSRAAAS
jgi:high-affinity iron transporter